MIDQYLIFTDLDGTLLDHYSYSWNDAKPAISRAKHLGVPIIINTSKTRCEVRTLLENMGLEKQPYVVENGSAIVLPTISTPLLKTLNHRSNYKIIDGQHVWQLGTARSVLCDFLKEIRKNHKWCFESYQDWSIEEIMAKTGLPMVSALESQNKEFSEPFQWLDTTDKFLEFEALVKENNFKILKGGRFYHLQGDINKASAFDFFETYKQELFNCDRVLKIIALGDNSNDIAMLNQADFPICIESPVDDFPVINNPNVRYSEQFGPLGWNRQIHALFDELGMKAL